MVNSPCSLTVSVRKVTHSRAVKGYCTSLGVYLHLQNVSDALHFVLETPLLKGEVWHLLFYLHKDTTLPPDCCSGKHAVDVLGGIKKI